MKDTPITNGYIKTINETIFKLSFITAIHKEPLVGKNLKKFIDDLQVCMNGLNNIDIDLVKAEFVDTLEDYSKVFFQKKVFEFKFEPLLNWKYDYENGALENWSKFQNEFTECYVTFQIDAHSIQYNRLKDLFINLSSRVTYLKHSIKTLLAHYDELGNTYLQANNTKIVSNEDKTPRKKAQPEYCIKVKSASKRKTDIIKILSSMYDAGMFAGEDGKLLTNKQKLMDAFGEFLGDDFSAYSVFLSQAKDKEEKIFLKPFREIEKEALRYFNEITE
jgi:hypothetical protein